MIALLAPPLIASWVLAATAIAPAEAATPVDRALVEPASTGGGLDLRWHAPDACPTREDVAATVDQLLGGAPTSSIRVDGRVEPPAGGSREWSLALAIESDGQRHEHALRAATCGELANAAALLAAVAVDPVAVVRTIRRTLGTSPSS